MGSEFREVLVATDFGDSCAAAVAHASRVAMESGGRLHLLHVLPPKDRTPGELADERRHCLERLAGVISADVELALKTVKEVIIGRPSEVIVAYAREEENDLIVVGTHGRSGLRRMALGSVADRVLRDAPCPVVVIKKGEDAEIAAESSPVFVEEAISLESPALDLIDRGRRLAATDVHIDPVSDAKYLVRMRIDGRLVTYCGLETTVAQHLINRLKTLAGLDIATSFRPLEGRLRLPAEIDDTEVRITTSPVAGGEAVSLRLLIRSRVFLPLDDLGLSASHLDAIRGMIRTVEGLVAISGPTGSGKTTLAYSMLESLATVERNMVSIEDPVEVAVPFMRQLSADEKHGVSIAAGLRAILRMDPDVVYVGEVRDAETAKVAMQAANSGRYVLSTMHARSVASTVAGLLGMGLASHTLAANLTGVVNVRLVRRLCTECRRPETPSEAFLQICDEAGVSRPAEIFRPEGCPACRRTGYRGRIGLYEVAGMTTALADAIIDGCDERAFDSVVRAGGVRPLRSDAVEKIAAGLVDEREASGVHWLA
jgi:type II secretory ATPase GspE/PulE/Tfp pilus assembly ATPase PilB-like protein/nucleotide-binding universal stress UspA family protein